MEDIIQFTDAPRQSLTKESSGVQIKSYFEGVQRLYQSGEQYPVNLDEVWPLAYSEKSKAVRALKKAFIESDDYICFAQNGETETGGYKMNVYMLTVSCFEYLIAKKVREVFNVYRNVFKKVATGEVKVVPAQPTAAEIILAQAQQLVEQEKRMLAIESKQLSIEEKQQAIESKQKAIEEKVSEIAARTKTGIQYSTIVGFASRYGLHVPLARASRLGIVASKQCYSFGLETGRIPDPRFGSVKTYPDSVLRDVFEKYYPKIRFR